MSARNPAVSFSMYSIEQLEERRLLAQLNAMVAEQLAREVSYRTLNNGTTVQFQGANIPYVVNDQWHDAKTGFDAYGLTSADNGPCLVLRGSEFLSTQFQYKDLASDANPLGIGYDQFAANWDSVRVWLKKQNATIDFVGHSLGGALAQWFAALWSNATDAGAGAGNFPVDQVFTFCSPGISDSRIVNPFLLTYASGAAGLLSGPGFNPARAHHVEHHIALGDMVSMGGEKFIAGTVITYSWSDLNLINKHIRPFLNAAVSPTAADLIGTPAPAPTVGALPIATLNAGAYVHNDADYRAVVATVQLVINAVALVVPAAVPLRLVPVILMRRDTCEASRKVLGALLNAITSQFNLTLANNVWTVQLGGQTNGLFKASLFEIDPSVTLTIDNNGGQSSLVLTGKMRIRVPAPNINIPVPAILGGPFNAANFIQLPTLDVNGRIDKNSMSVGGNMTLLGNLATINGNITFNWTAGQMVVSGNSNFMDSFVTTSGDITIHPDLSITSAGVGNASMPASLPLVGGSQLADGTYDFKFDPNNLPASYMEAIGLKETFGGFGPTLRAGARCTLAPSLTAILGRKRVRVFASGRAPTPNFAGFDVAPGQQWLVLDAAWQNPNPGTQIELIRPDGVVMTESDIASDPNAELFSAFNNSTSRAAMVLLPMPGTWQIRLPVFASLGTMDFNGFVDKISPMASFSLPTGGQRREPVHIHLDVIDVNADTTVTLYFDPSGAGEGGEILAEGLIPVGGALDYTWDVSNVALGDQFVYAELVSPDIATTTVISPPVHITEVRPEYDGGVFNFEYNHSISLVFDENVGASLSASDFLLTNLTTATIYTGAQLALSYDPYLSTVTITVPGAFSNGQFGILPDGNYHLSSAAPFITNSDGEILETNVSLDFYFLNADFDRDRDVDFDDLLTLARNYDEVSSLFFNGDTTYDHRVGFDDLLAMAQRYGLSLFSTMPMAGATQRHTDRTLAVEI